LNAPAFPVLTGTAAALGADSPILKTCGSCRVIKNRFDFHLNKNEKDGIAWECRKCDAARGCARRERKWEKEGRVFATVGNKICSGCRIEKSHAKFGKDRSAPYGLCCYCKDCRSKQKARSTLLRQQKERRVSLTPGNKICIHCDADKPLELFRTHAPTPDGRTRCCLECNVKKTHAFYKANIPRKRKLARISELEKKISEKESSLSYTNSRVTVLQGEIDQIHSFFDAIPQAIPKEPEGTYGKTNSAMTRLAAWLAVRA